MNWLCYTGETSRRECCRLPGKVESIQRKRKMRDIAECSKVVNYRKKKMLLRQGTLKNLMFLRQKGLPKEGRMRP